MPSGFVAARSAPAHSLCRRGCRRVMWARGESALHSGTRRRRDGQKFVPPRQKGAPSLQDERGEDSPSLALPVGRFVFRRGLPTDRTPGRRGWRGGRGAPSDDERRGDGGRAPAGRRRHGMRRRSALTSDLVHLDRRLPRPRGRPRSIPQLRVPLRRGHHRRPVRVRRISLPPRRRADVWSGARSARHPVRSERVRASERRSMRSAQNYTALRYFLR